MKKLVVGVVAVVSLAAVAAAYPFIAGSKRTELIAAEVETTLNSLEELGITVNSWSVEGSDLVFQEIYGPIERSSGMSFAIEKISATVPASSPITKSLSDVKIHWPDPSRGLRQSSGVRKGSQCAKPVDVQAGRRKHSALLVA